MPRVMHCRSLPTPPVLGPNNTVLLRMGLRSKSRRQHAAEVAYWDLATLVAAGDRRTAVTPGANVTATR